MNTPTKRLRRRRKPFRRRCIRMPERFSPFPSSCTRPYRAVLWGVCNTPLRGTSKKALPIILHPPLLGRLEGVCDTPLHGTSKKVLSIVLHPPLLGRLEGVCNTPLHGYIEKGPSHHPAPAPVGSFCGAYAIRPYGGHQKTENKQREDPVPGQIPRPR